MRRRTKGLVCVGFAAGVLGLAYLATRQSPGAKTGGDGQLYRLHVRVPLAYVAETRRRFAPEGQKALLSDVRRRVESLGYESTLTAIQDPTDNAVLTVLSRPRVRHPLVSDGIVTVERTEHVLPPPASVDPRISGSADPRTIGLPLESWLTADEAFAVRRALSEEMNTRHLKGLASVLEPRAPVAASMLYAKATVLDPRRSDPRSADQRVRDVLVDLSAPPPAPPPALLSRVDGMRALVEADAERRGLPLDVVHDEVRRAAYYASARGVASAVQSGAPPSSVALGVLLTRPLPHGGTIVDPVLMGRACPETGKERFVSPSAIWLAHAAGKPEVSGVRERARIEGVYASTEETDSGADPRADAIRRARAASMMSRAEKTLHRERWIRWYRRQAETSVP